MARLPPTPTTIKRLFAFSGNICCMPGCSQTLVSSKGVVFGEICHISAANEGGVRYDDNLNDNQRRDFKNLLIMCPTHHVEIDSEQNEGIYSIKRLQEIKNQHESNFRNDKYIVGNSVVKKLINSIKQEISQNNVYGNNISTQTGNIIYNNLGFSKSEVEKMLKKKIKPLADRIQSDLIKNIKEKVFTPDNIIFLAKALSDYASTDPEISDTDLFFEMIKEKFEEKTTSRASLIKAAIDKLSKLTKNQLLLLCYLFLTNKVLYTLNIIHDETKSNSTVVDNLEKLINQNYDFLKPELITTDIEILLSHSLITYQAPIVDQNLSEKLINEYGGVFNNGIKTQEIKEIDRLNLNDIAILSRDEEDKIYFKIQNIIGLSKKIEEMRLNETQTNIISDLFNRSIDRGKIKTFISKLNVLPDKFSEMLVLYSPNQVGIYIAIIYLRYIKFPSIFNKDEWIR